MQSLFHLAAGIDALLAAITTAWAALGEIVTAGALLLALDRLAAAIRFTYRAGRAVGTVWFRYVVPAALVLADGISWINAQIDWAEVRDIAIHGLKVVIAAVVAAGITAHQLLIRTSATLGKGYAALVVRTASPVQPVVLQSVVAPALQHPLAVVAAELESLPATQLRQLLGVKGRCSKTQLVALAVAS